MKVTTKIECSHCGKEITKQEIVELIFELIQKEEFSVFNFKTCKEEKVKSACQNGLAIQININEEK